jgi:flavin-dependent dehydrogenase
VVGAGPAGSVTALLLARSGFKVALLDSQTFPRVKPCGDCLSPQANVLLEQLGLWPDLLAAQPARLRGWRIVAPSGASFSARFADTSTDRRVHTALALSRERFDAILLAAAESAGVRVYQRYRVEQVLRSQDTVIGVQARAPTGEQMQLRAALTVGADGLRSTVRQRLGLTRRRPRVRKAALTAYASGVADLHELGELHVGNGLCVGLAPVAADRDCCNLTVVVDARRFGRALAGKPMHHVRGLLDSLPQLRGRLAHFQWRSTLNASGPFDRPVRAVTVPGAALVGDAAGYFDPFTGQGIYQALQGAQYLARSVAAALHARQTDLPLGEYAVLHHQLVTGARHVQRAIDYVCARPWSANRCIGALSHAPLAATRLIGVTGDILPARSLLSPACLLSFLIGFPGRSASP